MIEEKTLTEKLINDYAFIAWISVVLLAICVSSVAGQEIPAALLTLFSTLTAAWGFKKAQP